MSFDVLEELDRLTRSIEDCISLNRFFLLRLYVLVESMAHVSPEDEEAVKAVVGEMEKLEREIAEAIQSKPCKDGTQSLPA